MIIPSEIIAIQLRYSERQSNKEIMRQVRITTQNLDYPQENDCVLDENDPLHAIKKSNMVGGLGSTGSLQAANKFSEVVKLERRTLPEPLTANEIKKLKT